jgi:hypothetical protein
MVSDDWDLIAYIIADALVLSVAGLSAYEGIRVDFSKRGKDFQSGSHQRHVFYFAILVTSLYKFICMTAEGILFRNSTCADSHLCSFIRFSPDVAFIAAYGVMLSFWTQVSLHLSSRNIIIYYSSLASTYREFPLEYPGLLSWLA